MRGAMPEWTRRIRVRLTFAYAGLLLGLFALLALAFFLLLSEGLRGAADDTLRSESRLLLTGINVENGQVQQAADQPTAADTDAAFSSLVIPLAGAPPGPATSAAVPIPAGAATQLAAEVRQQHAGQFITVVVSNRPIRLYGTPVVDAPGTVLIVARSITDIERTLTMVRTALAVMAPLILATGALLGYTLAARALSPVRAMAATARGITERDLHRRLDLGLPHDELGELAATFNGMLARLEESFEGLKRFTADASHELRAPLASLRSEADVTLARPRSAVEYRTSLARISGELEDLSGLIDDLLMLARADAGREAVALTPVNLREIVDAADQRWRVRASDAGVNLLVEPADIWAVGDRRHLLRALDNLIENALRYTPNGGSIGISARRGKEVMLTVSDTGSGIDAAHLTHLFERFYRADPARSREDGGSGLGLSLVQWIAQAHGGTVSIASRPGQGTTVTLSLPVPSRPGEPSRPSSSR